MTGQTGWYKSSHSASAPKCVEISHRQDGWVFVRDSKARGRGPVLEFTAEEWAAFIAGAKDGEFDNAG